MGYFTTGIFLGYISTVVFLILTLKNRWSKDDLLEELYDWWDGESYYGPDLASSIMSLIGVLVLAPLVISLAWGLLLPVGLIIFIILKIRQRNIRRLKQWINKHKNNNN
tara:strand:- start:379 stop:705 length:327 start_codon:yes stop_codon:yes gene_type:complete